MKVSLCFAFLFSLFFIVTANLPQKVRIFEEDLSDAVHHKDKLDHNLNYDHDAFLGKDESHKFKDLTPVESKERLGKIVDKIDTNQDGKVSKEELSEWIQNQSQRYLRDYCEKSWNDYIIKNEKLSFDNYKNKTYSDDVEDDSLKRDQRRWAKADLDGDKLLTKDEFFHFFQPEESDRMRDVVIQETLEELDVNKDGVVNVEEYIGDMWAPEKGVEDQEPDWVIRERDMFASVRDVNKDGKLDHSEIGHWILPEDRTSHVMAETDHLMKEADKDNDGQLTKEEVLARYDLFVGSSATDYGQALLSVHEEL